MNNETYFARMRCEAEVVLQRDIDHDDAGLFAGVNPRTWRRYESGAQMPTQSIIRHFWVQVYREHAEVNAETNTSIAEFFEAVDDATNRWTPRKLREGNKPC